MCYRQLSSWTRACGSFFRTMPPFRQRPDGHSIPKTPHNNQLLSPPEPQKKKKCRRGNRGGGAKERKKRNTTIETDANKKKIKNIKIFNLSSYTPNGYEYSLLEKGLSYCPTHKADNFELFLDVHRFTRKLTLKRFFSIQEQRQTKNPGTSNSSLPQPSVSTYKIGKAVTFKGKSSFYPTSSKGNFIETFQELVLEDLEKLTDKKKNKFESYRQSHSGFLNKNEKEALNSLKQNKEIVIRPADKGGGGL